MNCLSALYVAHVPFYTRSEKNNFLIYPNDNEKYELIAYRYHLLKEIALAIKRENAWHIFEHIRKMSKVL